MKGIDAEIAEFFNETAAGVTKPIVIIDDATNRRLRWMIHKRVLVVMVVTYFAQTLDKGYVKTLCDHGGRPLIWRQDFELCLHHGDPTRHEASRAAVCMADHMWCVDVVSSRHILRTQQCLHYSSLHRNVCDDTRVMVWHTEYFCSTVSAGNSRPIG